MFYNHQVVRNMVITRAYREVSSPRSLHDQQHSLIIQDSFDAVISHQSSVLLGDLSCISPIGLRQLRSAASARLSLGDLDGSYGIVWIPERKKDSSLIIDHQSREIIDLRSN